jgi:tyrosyl-tRNA synthetase
MLSQRKEVPDEVEERDYPIGAQGQKIYILLVDLGLAPSFGEARRLIRGGGVHIHDDKGTHTVQDSTETIVKTDKSDSVLIQVGKRRFMRVRLVDKLESV